MENNGKIPFNPEGDQDRADLIEVMIAKNDMTYSEALKFFPSLNKQQQQSINNLVKAENTLDYNNAKKYIQTHFGVSAESFIIGDKLTEHEQLIHSMTNSALSIFEERNFKEQGNLNFQIEIPEILEQVKKRFYSKCC